MITPNVASLWPLWEKSVAIMSEADVPIWLVESTRRTGSAGQGVYSSAALTKRYWNGTVWSSPVEFGPLKTFGHCSWQRSDGHLMHAYCELLNTAPHAFKLRYKIDGIGGVVLIANDRYCPQVYRLIPSEDVMVLSLDNNLNVKVNFLRSNGDLTYTVEVPEIDAGFKASELGTIWATADGRIGLPYADVYNAIQTKYSTASGDVWTDV
jgi:hypothetical protein